MLWIPRGGSASRRRWRLSQRARNERDRSSGAPTTDPDPPCSLQRI